MLYVYSYKTLMWDDIMLFTLFGMFSTQRYSRTKVLDMYYNLKQPLIDFGVYKNLILPRARLFTSTARRCL